INAVLMRKKMIQLSSKFMGKNEQIHSIIYKKKLGLPNIELDKFKEESFDEIYKKGYGNENLINNYISKFHQLTENENGISKIVRIIKKRYFFD
ncbi:hypothetical protein N8Z07_04560, partial [Pelagibacteraceae bacterium]|nr:hypothetical protein [Pelagibacteraceae bacterium]